MTGMTWQEVEVDGRTGSWCEFSMGESLTPSTMDTHHEKDGTWSWEVSLYASEREHFASGYGCANESKAKHMAMHLVAALLQIMDGVKPHEVD